MKKQITLLLLCALFFTANAQKGVNVPYHEVFEYTSNVSKWTMYNVNNDDGEWLHADYTYGVGYQNSGCMMYIYSFANAGQDWLVSPGISLTAGKTYRFSFKYKAFDGTKVEKMKVYFGSDSLPANFSSVVVDFNPINTTVFTDFNYSYSPVSSGNYYMAFYAYSDVNQGAILIDEFDVIEESSAIENVEDGIQFIGFYPNPAADRLNVKGGKGAMVSISNIMGNILLSKQLSSDTESIEISNLAKGVYIIRFDKNGMIRSRKFTKN